YDCNVLDVFMSISNKALHVPSGKVKPKLSYLSNHELRQSSNGYADKSGSIQDPLSALVVN
ncbi:12599_t:CDS:1, partial [Cetraspora pellucida]